MTLYKNARIFTGGHFVFGSFRVEDGRFAEILPGGATEPGTDLHGQIVIPGLVDIHIHGCGGADLSDGTLSAVENMGAYLASRGVTSFVPASMTLPPERLTAAFSSAASYREKHPANSARLMGVRMEGPFLSAGKKGAQNRDFLLPPDLSLVRQLNEDCGGLIRVIDIAPDLPGAAELAETLSPELTVSAGHTEADYDCAADFFDRGGSHVTHLFNAMPALHHRAPGVIGAAAERESVSAELISDGYHVHPSAVRMAFRLFPGRLCLVSDALRCCGMPEGMYELGGQTVFLRDGVARLPDGTIAGAASDLYEDMLRAVSFGIPAEEAVAAVTEIPARIIGQKDEIGVIVQGARADFIVCDEALLRRAVYLGGELVGE